MKSYDFDAVTFGGDVYCNECLPSATTPESEEVYPIFADAEFEHVPVCCECGRNHNYVSLLA